jgi:hypothetical protein
MRMPSSTILIVLGSLSLGLFIDALFFMNLSCTQPLYADLIRTTAGGSCPEFWFNRYQTFIAAVVALIGAALTVNTMWRQTEAVRADEAEMRLARYSGALLDVMLRYNDVEPTADNADNLTFRDFDKATDIQTIREAMIDAALGPDRVIVATLMHRARVAALATYHEQLDVESNAISVVPIYKALCASIFQRREMLREGTSVYDISKIAFVDAHEINAAHEERREPILRK